MKAELYILGPAEIRHTDGTLAHSFLAGPKRLALLVYLLMKRPAGFHRRDSLLPLFWPEGGQKSARNALSNMLYHIRRSLGPEAIINRGSEEVCLRPEAFWADVIAFEEHSRQGRWQQALSLYRGDLLKGFHIPDAAPEFDHWLDQERNRLCQLATEGAWALAQAAESRQQLQEAQDWARKAARLNPLCEQSQSQLIVLLHRTGNWKGALDAYQDFASLLQKEEEEPSPSLTRLVSEIQAQGPRSSSTDQALQLRTLPPASTLERIAVLPFETLGQDKATAFTDAIHGDILTRLSSLAGLRVTSRTSVMRYRKPQRLLPQIAQELGVEWILSGEVQEAENWIQVWVRLIHAAEDSQVWAECYQRRLSADTLFQIQAEITKQIAEALQTRLSREEEAAIRQRPTSDLESYCLHAQGRWSLDQRTEEGIQKAAVFFKQALARDSGYALAWVGLADALVLLYEYGFARAATVLPEAEKALQRALELAPQLAETSTTIALLHEAKREGSIAEQKYKKAIELRPNYAEAHNWLSWTSLLIGKAEQALESAKRAVESNPLSPEALSNLSLSLLVNGEHEKAVREARRIRNLQPDWTTAPFYEGIAQYHQQNYTEALHLLDQLSVPWAGTGPLLTWALAHIHTGNAAIARQVRNQLAKSGDNFGQALISAALGETDRAFEQLAAVRDWHYWAVLSIHHLYPQELGPLRRDNRFAGILRQVYQSWGVVPPTKQPAVKSTNGAGKQLYYPASSVQP